MQIIEPITEAAMVASFLLGELPSERFGKKIRAALERSGYDETIVTNPDLDNTFENSARAELLEFRGYPRRDKELFFQFPTDVTWIRANAPSVELLESRYIDWGFWLEISLGTRRIDVALKHFLCGAPKRWNLLEHIRSIAIGFE